MSTKLMSIEFLTKAYQLKTLARSGWLRAGITQPESVADHSWALSLLALYLCPAELNKTRVLELCIVHDLPEVIVGDITPHDHITKEEKHHLEWQAAHTLLPAELLDIWTEYQEGISPESKFVHSLDKLEMGIQAKIYAPLANTQEFIHSAQRSTDPQHQTLLLRILSGDTP